MAKFIGSDGEQYRYTNCDAGDVVQCYDTDCQCPDGTPMVDFVARWEDVGDMRAPANAKMYTCQDHKAGFDTAKERFRETQKTTTAAYMTRAELREPGPRCT